MPDASASVFLHFPIGSIRLTQENPSSSRPAPWPARCIPLKGISADSRGFAVKLRCRCQNTAQPQWRTCFMR